jgi:HK97 family phage major capsid protein
MPLDGYFIPAARGIQRVSADNTAVSAQVAEAVANFTTEFKTFKDAQAASDKAIKDLIGATDKEAKAAAEAATKATEKVEATAANLLEIEQKLADKLTSGDHVPAATVGQILVSSEEYKALALKPGSTPGAGFKLRVEANTIIGQEGSPPENADTLVPTARRAGIVPGAFRTLRVRDVIPTIPTTSNAWQFTRELLFTNNAAEVAEGAAKAESVLTFEDSTVNIRTIAHFIKASNQILADAPALRAYIDGRLRYGVELREEKQIVAGDGLGQNISGMTTGSNYTAFTPTSGDNAIDSVNRAKYAILGDDYMATALIMNPADWGALERLRAGSNFENGYLVGNPFGTITPVLWGLPVIVTNSMTSGKFLVADFATSYEYAERQSTVIDLGFVNDDFTKNLVTIRAEKRGALATIRPASTRFGNLTL